MAVVKSDPVASVETIWADMNQRLGHLGRVVVAGGAVRDSLLGRTPKDYDVFILRPYTDSGRGDVNMAMDCLTAIHGEKEAYGLSEDFIGAWYWQDPVEELGRPGIVIQVMFSDAPTTLKLLGSFDWNIAKFAYDSDGLTVHPHAPAVFYDADDGRPHFRTALRLSPGELRWPMSSLRRGIDFARRYRMRLRPADIRRLADALEREEDPRG